MNGKERGMNLPHVLVYEKNVPRLWLSFAPLMGTLALFTTTRPLEFVFPLTSCHLQEQLLPLAVRDVLMGKNVIGKYRYEAIGIPKSSNRQQIIFHASAS